MIQAVRHEQGHDLQFHFIQNISHSYRIKLYHFLNHRQIFSDQLSILEGGCLID
jgi:glucose-6-phosphate isomerase